MTSVVDFLERMGSEAQWRYASSGDIEAALADAKIDAPMSAAILARSAVEVQALLGQVKMMPQQTAVPSPFDVPKPPQPGPGEGEQENEEEEESGKSAGDNKQLSNACNSSSMLQHSSL
jgi:hypothetical protein